MASDDEIRKVAEDIRALGRALSRDLRDAVDQARMGGHSTRDAIRQSIREVKADTKRSFRQYRPSRGYWPTGYGGPHWGGRPWVPPGQTEDPAGADPSGAGGSPGGPPPWARGHQWSPRSGYVGGPPWMGPSWHRTHRPRPSRPALPPIRRRWDASTLIGMLVVVFGIAWLVSAVGALHPSVEGVVAVGLMLLGASLVLTARTDWSLSRRSWPVWLGIGMMAVLVATSTTFGIGNTLNSVSFGNTNVAVTSLPRGTVHGGFGNLTVDLTGLTSGGALKVVSIAGNTTVNLPPQVPLYVSVDARVVGGQICVNGHDVGNGAFTHPRLTLDWDNPVAGISPTLDLSVHQMFGQIMIAGNCSGPPGRIKPIPPTTPPVPAT